MGPLNKIVAAFWWYCKAAAFRRVVRTHEPTWGSLSDIASFPVCSRVCGPPPRVDSRTGHSSGSPRASTARWPSGRTGRRCSADSHRMSAERAASGGPHPPAPCKTQKKTVIKQSKSSYAAVKYWFVYGCLKSDRGHDFVLLFTGFILQLQKKSTVVFLLLSYKRKAEYKACLAFRLLYDGWIHCKYSSNQSVTNGSCVSFVSCNMALSTRGSHWTLLSTVT